MFRTVIRNPLLRLLAVNWLIGLAATAIVVGGLLLTDAAGQRSLILRSDAAGPALALLFVGFLVTLTSAAMGTAIMGLAEPPGRRRPPPARPAAGLAPRPLPAQLRR